MRLRRKTVGALAVLMILLFLLLSVASKPMYMEGFVGEERTQMGENLSRVQGIITRELETLSDIAGDWAAWDDTYEFIEDGNQDYLDSNLGNNTFLNLQLNLIFMVDGDGQTAFVGAYDDAGLPMEGEFELAADLTGIKVLFDLRARDSAAHGVVATSKGPMMVASRPIQDSAKQSDINGILVMGRLFDDGTTARISQMLLLPVSHHRLGSPDGSEEFAEAESRLAGGGGMYMDADDALWAAGYFQLTGMDGVPLMTLCVHMPRGIYQHGLESFERFHLALLGAMAAIGLAATLILELYVLDRLEKLDSEVGYIGLSPGRAGRVTVEGSDEITALSESINQMLDMRSGVEKELERLNGDLTSKVAELEKHKALTVEREIRMIELKKELAESGRQGVPDAN